MKVYVIFSSSCPDCNSAAGRVLDHKPSENEIFDNELVIGGMWCIHSVVALCEINGESEELLNE